MTAVPEINTITEAIAYNVETALTDPGYIFNFRRAACRAWTADFFFLITRSLRATEYIDYHASTDLTRKEVLCNMLP